MFKFAFNFNLYQLFLVKKYLIWLKQFHSQDLNANFPYSSSQPYISLYVSSENLVLYQVNVHNIAKLTDFFDQ